MSRHCRCYREDDQTWSFRGSKSRNKVSVGEPAEGSLTNETYKKRKCVTKQTENWKKGMIKYIYFIYIFIKWIFWIHYQIPKLCISNIWTNDEITERWLTWGGREKSLPSVVSDRFIIFFFFWIYIFLNFTRHENLIRREKFFLFPRERDI